jgi:Metallo-peptidase family M12B Reprolysin-like
MANLSLRNVASNCLGLGGTFSVVRDVYGYPFGSPNRKLSLRTQLILDQGPTLDVNPILVAVENFTAADRAETQDAIQIAREIFGKVGLGIRKLNWQQITVASAGGYATIDSGGEAHDLTDDWNGPGGALDLFVVRVMNGADGRSAVGGPCDKDDKDEMTGSVVSLNGDAANSGNTFAHEMGHYMGLDHIADTGNFIGGNGGSDSWTGIYAWQGDVMKKHCYVGDRC